MNLDDMILVSIDDHMIEPPTHVREPRAEEVAGRRAQGRARGRHRPVGVPGREDEHVLRHGRHGGLALRGVGLQPGHLHRAAARLLRRARARARHERQRRARLHVLPDHGRVERPDLRRGARQGDRPRHAAGLQRLGHRRVVRRRTRGASSRSASSPCGTSTPPWPRSAASPRRAAGRSASSRRRTCRASRASSPATGTRCSPRSSEENMVLSLHIGAGLRRDPAARGGAGRPPDGAGLPDQRHHRAGPAVRPDAAPLPRPQGRPVRGRHRLDPLLLRPHRPPLRRTRSGCTATSAASCPPRSSATTSWPATSPTRRACCCGTASASTSSPGSATTPTPTPRGPSRPSSPGRSSRTPGAADDEIHKITWENACRFYGWDPFAHTTKEQATVGALRGVGPRRRRDPDVPDEWRKRNEAAGIGVVGAV